MYESVSVGVAYFTIFLALNKVKQLLQGRYDKSERYSLTSLADNKANAPLLCRCQANIKCRVVCTRIVSMYSRRHRMSTGYSVNLIESKCGRTAFHLHDSLFRGYLNFLITVVYGINIC